MKEYRWAWVVAGTLLLTSGVTAGITTYLWWLPCRGAMLVGTILESVGSAEFSDECLVRMDSGTPYPLIVAVTDATPGLYELSAASIMLAALSWFIVVLAVPMSAWARLFGFAFAMSLVVLALAGLPPSGREEGFSPIGGPAFLLVDITAVVTLILVVQHWWRSPRTAIRLVLLLSGASAFGISRTMLDYAVMGTWSQANWDTPPGTGYLPALGLALAGAGLIVLTSRRWPSELSASPSQQVEQVDPVP